MTVGTSGEQASDAAVLGDHRLRLLVERAPVAMGILSRKGEIEFVNPAMARHFGEELAAVRLMEEFVRLASPDEAEEKRALAYWHDEIFRWCSGKSEPEPLEWRVVTPDGIKDVVFRASIVGAKVVATLEDVTSSRRADELEKVNRTLRASDEKYRRLFWSITDAFVRSDLDGRILEVNQGFEELVGYSIEELRRMRYPELTPEKWHPLEERLRKEQLLPEGQTDVFEKEFWRKDGTVIPVELRVFMIRDGDGEMAGTWAIVSDISARKALEEQLRRANAELEERVAERTAAFEDRMKRYLSLFNSLADMVLVIDQEGRILEANNAAVAYMGYSHEEFLAMSHADLRCDLEPEECKRLLAEAIGGQTVNRFIVMVRQDGSCFPAEVTLSGGEADGRPVAMVVVREVSERIEAERVLRESEERFRHLAEAASEGIGVTQEGIIVDVNQQLADILGSTVEEMIGRPALEVIAPEYRQLVAHNMKTEYGGVYEADFLHKDGSRIPIEGRGVATMWNGRVARVSVLSDLTEARRLEAELAGQRAELARVHKLAMLSEVSAGVLHQVSQPLSSIMNNVAAAVHYAGSGEIQKCKSHAPLAEVARELKLLQKTMTRLRALAHPDAEKRSMEDLNAIVREAIAQVANAAHRGRVRFETILAPDLPPVRVDAVQLGQVFVNLMRNAIDAMASCVPDRRLIEVVTCSCDGEEVEVLVRDGGPGIAPEARTRLFEPFFTTKSEGMGIGLSLSRTIVTAHGGRIEAFNNEDGPGASFHLVLPTGEKDQ